MLTAEAGSALVGIGAAALPDPPVEGDGNEWGTGDCWLYCERESVPVLWLGVVTAAGGVRAGLAACAECIAVLHGKAVAEMLGRDRSPIPQPRRARHARPRSA
ncbi:hypothetical protein ACGF0D_07580 [Kitasatospora sp. NPDC048298]|uniref:hypothetical protein n=1 Tax=Kitasatospora sp. NPDC048298 TaxID=3364049 RepID=UPI00371AE44E